MDASERRQHRKTILDGKRKATNEVPRSSTKPFRAREPFLDVTNNEFRSFVNVVDKDSSAENRRKRKAILSLQGRRLSGSIQHHSVPVSNSSQNCSVKTRQTIYKLQDLKKNLVDAFNVCAEDRCEQLPYTGVACGLSNTTNLHRNLSTVSLTEYCQLNTDVHGTLTDEEWNLFDNDQELVKYEDLGDPIYKCKWCGAIFWKFESLSITGTDGEPIFGLCCGKGKVQLPFMVDPPTELHELYFGKDDKSTNFLDQIRVYNSCFAFTSMGGKIDHSINRGGGRYSFHLSGENHHRIGTLLPVEGQPARFAQLYIYDTKNETTNRMSNFSGGRTQMDDSILDSLKQMLDSHNVFAHSFRMARDRYESGQYDNMKLRLIRLRRCDGRTYNLPSADEVAGLIVGDFDNVETHRDIIIQHQGGMLQRIDELHPSYLPLQYPLLFPYGEDGYREDIIHSESSNPTQRRLTKLTMRQIFAFRLQEREFEISVILYAKRLFQQFIVAGYTMIESSRLRFIRLNQKKLRADCYKGVIDAISRGMQSGEGIGKRILLPSSFTGGPRYLFQHYQDSMAICRWAGYPQIFLTFTCNPNWPEITRFLKQRSLKPEDRPDIVSRVFKMKLTSLLKDIKSGSIFGNVKSIIYTIEFQKRGLPHCHILLFLSNVGACWSGEDIDKFISAEIPDKNVEPELFEAVQEFMVHGPCGELNIKSPCMLNSSCSKFYPKEFNDSTHVNDDGFPVYKRSDNDRVVCKRDITLNNQWIVPYNQHILLKYRSHINVEWCNQSNAVKYLFKYINKGSDRVTAVLSETDEIKAFLDCRYISACEAAWRIFAFDIHYRQPTVVRLSIHLPGEHNVIYGDDVELEEVVNNEKSQKSIFTAWLDANKKFPELGSNLTYVEYPMSFVYKSQQREWVPRRSGFCIGRLVYIPFNVGEAYYLSMLVAKIKGPKSYEDIRTINGVVHNTFREACYALGLLDNDNEFIEAIKEASVWGSATFLRRLFVTMLMSNSLCQPHKVWHETWENLCDDVVYLQQRMFNEPDKHFSDEQIQNYGLLEIEKILHLNGRSLSDFPNMPCSVVECFDSSNNQFIVEQLNYDRSILADEFSQMEAKLTAEQKDIFRVIVDAVEQEHGGFFFVYGYGGTGKTFLWNILTSYIRSQGKIVLTVASSGIAATLLPGGRTAHSRFCIPIDINDDSTCNISKGSPLAELLILTKLIIWDEAPMVRRQCFEALDRSLRDIMQDHTPDAENLPFGGKCVVLGGDFRQILPVIKNGSRSDIVYATINASYLWSYCQVLTLSTNMRLQSNSGHQDIEDLKQFADWILKLGDGKLAQPHEGITEIEIPSEFLIHDFNDPIQSLVQCTYPDFSSKYNSVEYLKERAILAARVEHVMEVNNYMLSCVSSLERVYLSADKILNDGSEGGNFSQYHSVDYLNSISVSGMPSHELRLKVGVAVMLLRNIDQSAGLCNGTRLILTELGDHVLAAKVISGARIGETIYLPRMNTSLSDSTLPFKFQRRQFPVAISYCMTINKSQGQSLSTVGIYLPRPVFFSWSTICGCLTCEAKVRT